MNTNCTNLIDRFQEPVWDVVWSDSLPSESLFTDAINQANKIIFKYFDISLHLLKAERDSK